MTSTIWKNDTNGSFTLSEPYFVTAGNTLTIEKGTIIKCKTGTTVTSGVWNTLPAMLVVCRGATLYANGTKDDPIIFTTDQSVTDETTKGKWGGVVILGKVLKTSADEDTAKYFDTIDYKFSSALTAQSKSYYINTSGNISTTVSSLTLHDAFKYGYEDTDGTVNNTNVSMNYVSIRHAGFQISTTTVDSVSTANKMAGLSIYGLNSGSVSDIEVYAAADNGVAIKGGSSTTSNMLVAYSGGNAFDFDEGHCDVTNKTYKQHSKLMALCPQGKVIEVGGDTTTLSTQVWTNYYSHSTFISVLANGLLLTQTLELCDYTDFDWGIVDASLLNCYNINTYADFESNNYYKCSTKKAETCTTTTTACNTTNDCNTTTTCNTTNNCNTNTCIQDTTCSTLNNCGTTTTCCTKKTTCSAGGDPLVYSRDSGKYFIGNSINFVNLLKGFNVLVNASCEFHNLPSRYYTKDGMVKKCCEEPMKYFKEIYFNYMGTEIVYNAFNGKFKILRNRGNIKVRKLDTCEGIVSSRFNVTYPKLQTTKYEFTLGLIQLVITRDAMTEEFVRIDLVGGDNMNLQGALINNSLENIRYGLYDDNKIRRRI